MANKGYPTNSYPTNPPPYGQPGAMYPPAGATTTVYNQTGQPHTVVVQPPPQVVVQQRTSLFKWLMSSADSTADLGIKTLEMLEAAADQVFPTTPGPPASLLRGLLGQLGHELNILGKVVSREVDWTADQINKSLATTAQGDLLKLFQSGNVVQLVSRSSGRSLQIVQNPQGQLVVDGLGQDGAPNATWTIVNEGSNQVRLHNNNNFLTVMNGNTLLIPMPPGTTHGIETKFQLVQSGMFVYLESLKERGKHIGVLPGGQLKPALATGKEQHSQFGVKLLHSPYGVARK